MADAEAVVYIVEDDPAMREALDRLIRASGWKVMTFPSAQDYLRASGVDAPSCLVLDVGLPGISGLDLQSQLADSDRAIPIVFITAAPDVPATVRAMKAGAVEFLTKPLVNRDLLDGIRRAIERSRATRRHDAEVRELRTRHASLSPRERQVMELVIAGLPNKQIAAMLEIKEGTVKAHRWHVMQGMQAASLADLIRMAERLLPRA